MPNTTPQKTAPLLALCLLPAMYILRFKADNYLLFSLGAVLSLLPEAVLLIIVNAAFKRKGAPAPVTLTLVTLSGVFFAVMSVLTVISFLRVNSRLSAHYVSNALVACLIILSAFYVASLSEGAVNRFCSAAVLTSVMLFGLIVLMALKNGSVQNLHLSSASPPHDVKKGLLAGALVFEPDVYFLLAAAVSASRPSWASFLVKKCALLFLFTVPAVFVLGSHVGSSFLPAYDLSAYSKSVVIERFDSLFMGMVTLAAVTKAAIELSALRRCVRALPLRKGVQNEKA